MLRLQVASYLMISILSLSWVTGCATTQLSSEASAQQPVSQQDAGSDAQKRAKVHTELGSLYLQKGTLAVALDEARVALSADSNYAPAHNLAGLTYMQLRENASAEKSFEQALQLAPADPEINNNFGWFLCQSGRERQALEYFNRAIKAPLYTTPALPNINAGICLLRLNENAEAEAYFIRAYRLDSGNARAIFLLAETALRRSQFGVARNWLSELSRLTEPTPESLWLALRVARKTGNREEELQYSTRLRRDFSDSPEALKLAQGQYD